MAKEKQCTWCKEWKPLSEFYKDKIAKDGYYPHCKECKRARQKAYYAPRKEQTKKTRLDYYDGDLKLCKKCGKWRHTDEYSLNHDHWDNLSHICKNCSRYLNRKRYHENKERYRRSNREWYRKNREKVLRYGREWYHKNRKRKLEQGKQWYRNNPAKSRVIWHRYKTRKLNADGDFTSEEWEAILRHYCPDGRCLACGKKRKLTNDHVIPLSQGGSNYIANIQPLCQSCNSRKGCHKTTDHRPDGGSFARSLMNENSHAANTSKPKSYRRWH